MSVATNEKHPPHIPTALGATQRRQIGVITVVALALYALLRWLPTGTSLSHMDFRVDGSQNSIEFCDPLNPQFIPVVAVASPVAMTVRTATPPVAGEPVRATVKLETSGGKPIAPADLLVVHTRPLHLMLVDPTLTDYQHVHPEPTAVPGEWAFDFMPHAAGAYRVFADFTPAATNRGLYASADLKVGESAGRVRKTVPQDAAAAYRFTLTPATGALFARVPMDLKFTVSRDDGGAVPLEPVMDAYAHLVAFDEGRSGFAHLHPVEADLAQQPDAARPELNFKITIPSVGRYVIWAQVKIEGEERFVPFWFDVVER